MPFREWASLVPEARGPLDFERFRVHRELYEEHMASDREVVLAKATQVGASALAVRWVLLWADRGYVALYTFPDDRTLRDFSRQRIRPLIRGSAHLRSRVPDDAVDNVGQRQVGSGWLYCRGVQRGPVESIDADVIAMDEVDYSDQLHLEASERRVSGPDALGLIRRLGVPTVPGFGISAAFDATDQRIWTVKCRRCREWNPIRGAEAFAANVDAEQVAIVCRKCRKRLDVQAYGEWVATFPDRDTVGYHLPKLAVPGVRLADLIANSKKTRPDERQHFYNRDLGEPYAPAEHRLSLEQIRACVDESIRPLPSLHGDRLVVLGCDVASVRALNVVIEEVIDRDVGRKVFVGEVEDGPDGTAFEQLCVLMHRYNVTLAAIDRAPERRFSAAFVHEFRDRATMVGYYTPGADTRGEAPASYWDHENRVLTVWRTIAIDATLERFRARQVVLPPLDTLPTDYAAHLGNVVRQNVEGADGRIRAEYRSLGDSDYLHAEVYALAARELMWSLLDQRPAELVPLAPPVLETPGLYRSGFDDNGGEYRPGFEGHDDEPWWWSAAGF
jgi:hypothetical protein